MPGIKRWAAGFRSDDANLYATQLKIKKFQNKRKMLVKSMQNFRWNSFKKGFADNFNFFSPKSLSFSFSRWDPTLMDKLSFSIWETFFTWTKKLSEIFGSTVDFPEDSEIFCWHRPFETTTSASASTSGYVLELSDKVLVELELENADEKKFEIFPRKFVRFLTGVDFGVSVGVGVELFLSTKFSSADDDVSVIGKIPLSKFEPFSDIVTPSLSMTSLLTASHKKQTSSKNAHSSKYILSLGPDPIKIF